MHFIERNSIRIILINDKDEVLLMCVDDKRTTGVDGTYRGPFWVLVGGGMEPDETIEDAAFRELHEEVGFSKDDFELGPVVWLSEVSMVLAGKPSHIKDTYVVAKAKKSEMSHENFTDWEKEVVKKMKWCSLEQIKAISDPVYPTGLAEYLPDILDGNYPEKPILLYK